MYTSGALEAFKNVCVRFSSHKEEGRKRRKAKDEGTRYELSSCHAGQVCRLISKSDRGITGPGKESQKKKANQSCNLPKH